MVCKIFRTHSKYSTPRKYCHLALLSVTDIVPSVTEKPLRFDIPILKSALRIATIYDNPILRAFAIEALETASLSDKERIQMACEFDIPKWKDEAYTRLCQRKEAITIEEAAVLGLDSFVEMAKARENWLRRRTNNIDIPEEENIEEFGIPKPRGTEQDSACGTSSEKTTLNSESLQVVIHLSHVTTTYV
jgi:hypothetical protein